jgi:hypothetical protein
VSSLTTACASGSASHGSPSDSTLSVHVSASANTITTPTTTSTSVIERESATPKTILELLNYLTKLLLFNHFKFKYGTLHHVCL